jgi:uncharacterized iron-regulated membrane protein
MHIIFSFLIVIVLYRICLLFFFWLICATVRSIVSVLGLLLLFGDGLMNLRMDTWYSEKKAEAFFLLYTDSVC